ncbi:ATP-binding cassette domain-containing protein [Leucobacter insecticola]|uniref:ATP-binding cassette domain-containing protein n=1 Tax=Leucobacter insecticola TaxID=2714934 RepID=A0A6G8FK60_9MICO|nr:oligopeptide/dipeptide ABC transporter ATP-binding protein [Leucobacter insecticola]QIM16826.1 ATP-binding cassette domain-containing protein [Leucobacter insecticola]
MNDTTTPALVEARDLSVRYVTRRSAITNRPVQHLTGVDRVSLSLQRGQSYGLVGESGSGKSTLGRALIRLEQIAEGSVHFDGRDITTLKGEALRRLRPRMQMIFQDPMGSLNPRQSIATILGAPLRVHKLAGSPSEQRQRISDTLDLVGLPSSVLTRYPHEFSGGQRQRIGIARAVIQQPDFIVADEPVSALDVSVQAQIVNLLQDIKESLGLTSLVVAHDLAVVRHISDTVGVMYLGSVVEEAPSDELYAQPLHPYTRALLSAAPVPDPELEDTRERIVLSGEIPSPSAVHQGCRFASRCPVKKSERCDNERPELRLLVGKHRVACHWAEEFLPDTVSQLRGAS